MKQIVVIGVGNFGHYLAKELYTKGYEVIVIDKSQARVQDIHSYVTQAVVADSTDMETLRTLGVDRADLVIIGIGSNLSESILTALNVKDLGVKKIFAKAQSENHGRILEKLGVNEVFFPEKDLAVSVARQIHNPNMIDHIPFVDGYTIVEMAPPRSFIGKRLKEANIINKFGVQVMAIKDVLTDQLSVIPTGEYMMKDSDILILMGQKDSIDRIKDAE